MIVRINQFDPGSERKTDGWPVDALTGPIQCIWPVGTSAFDLFVLDRDETDQPLTLAFRQGQMRRIIPSVVQAMRSPGEYLVARLDGQMLNGELGQAINHAINPACCERFSISSAERFDHDITPPLASVRLLPCVGHLPTICADAVIGLERSVRLRLFALPEDMVNPFLDTASLDDERWREILPASSFVLSTVQGLDAIHLFTRRYDSEQVKQRISGQLNASARKLVEAIG